MHLCMTGGLSIKQYHLALWFVFGSVVVLLYGCDSNND